MTAISDIHCHPTIRLYNGNKDIWFSDKAKDSNRSFPFPAFAEAEFAALAQSRVRIVFVSLYAIEQGFITNLAHHADIAPDAPLINEILNETISFIIKKFSKNGTVIDFLEKIAARWLSSMTGKRFEEISSPEHDYYTDLKKELEYLEKGVNQNGYITENGKRINLKIFSNYNQLQKELEINDNYNYTSENDNTIALVLTVEGGHSLGIGQKNTQHITIAQLNQLSSDGTFANSEVQTLYNKVHNNILDMKQRWGNNGSHCPFFITIAHHFYNQLCGHNMSFPGIAHSIFDQTHGMNTPITEFGKKIIGELLSEENGRRILIDTKHMSGETKQWYYNYVSEYNRTNNRPIPIISSHSAVSGNKTISDQNSNDHNKMDENYARSQTFNLWDINLSDEEILIIHESEGLIGLNLDQRILSGKKMADFINNYSYDKSSDIIYQSVWAEPVLQNILHIVEVVNKSNNKNKKYVWDMITIGSDYDGIINPLDAFCYAEDLENLRNVLIQKLELQSSWNPLLAGQNATDVIDSVMFKNSVKFLKKHFNYTSYIV